MLILILSFVMPVFSQVTLEETAFPEKEIENIRLLKEEILNPMKNLKIDETKLDHYSIDIETFRSQSRKYTELKNRECRGEFSSIRINEDGVEKLQKKKLTKEERQACYSQLKNFHITFTNLVFELRKKYLALIHKKQLSSLETTREQTIAKLELSFKKKNRRSKRRSKARRKKR